MDLPAPTPPHQSATFAERGVSVPFTTPTLAGARVRMDTRHRLVLVVPNPSGRRGVYVLPWIGVRDMCCPTLHDGMLHDYICMGGAITPASVRSAARRVALDGAAGRAAHAAAVTANQADALSRQATNRHLLFALAARTNVHATLAEIADLAGVVDAIGVGSLAEKAAIPMRMARLKGLRHALSAWSCLGADDTGNVSMACSMADLALRCGELVLKAARERVADIERLLCDWRCNPGEVTAVVTRPAWVLDGWDLPSMLWTVASGDAARRMALSEMGEMLTVLPAEAGEWIGASIDAEASQAVRRMAGLNRRLQGGLDAVDLTARNEQFRAMAA